MQKRTQTRWKQGFRTLAVVVIAAGSAGCSPAQAGTQDGSGNGASPVAAAAALIRAEQYDAAIAKAEQGLVGSPTDPRLLTVEAVAYSMKGDESAALKNFEKAAKASPDFLPALRGQAQILTKRHDPGSLPVLKHILALQPEDGTAREMLGVAQAENNDCAAAVATLTGLNLAQLRTGTLVRYGQCLFAMGSFEAAIPVFTQLLAVAPGSEDARYDLALAQWRAGKNNDAAETLSPLLEHTADPEVLDFASDVFEAAGNTPEAVKAARQAIVLNPTRAESYVRFAELCMAHESYDAGVQMLTAGITRMPHEASLFVARGMLYGGMAKYTEAEADFQSAERWDQTHGTGAYGVGLMQAQANHPQEALTTVRGALESHPDDAQLNFLLARLLLESGAQPGSPAFQQALASAQKAVAHDPHFLPAHDLLAKIYTQNGQVPLAIEQCKASLALDPSDQNALYRLMRASREVGDTATAQKLARQVEENHQHARDTEKDRLRFRIEARSSGRSGEAASGTPDGPK